jgi:hypothetical protein
MTKHIIDSDGTRRGGFNAEGQYDPEQREPAFSTEVRMDSGKGYDRRWGVGIVPAGQTGRQTTGGPLVPGPWAYTFGKATVLSAEPMAEAPSVRVEWGDTIVLDGVPFEIQPLWRFGRPDPEYAALILIDDDGDEAQRMAEIKAYTR